MNSFTHTHLEKSLPRRRFLQIAKAALATTLLTGALSCSAEEDTQHSPTRWGFVGTGSIANKMAKAIVNAPSATLTASSSRTLSKAEDFSKQHGASKAFGSWAEMCQWDGIDAVYIATPTFVKEEIAIAAAKAGKHVLCEKPLASTASLQRILAACHENNVAFMDGTHFSHHPRTAEVKRQLDEVVGERRRLHTVFQFNLRDQSNIRLNPELEPMGGIGDAGWYNMRAIAEYLNPELKVTSVSASLRRHPQTRGVVGGTGFMSFDDGSTTTFSCAMDAGAYGNDARIDGSKGALVTPRFLSNDHDNSASYTLLGRGKNGYTEVKVESAMAGSTLMFEDFSAQIHNPAQRQKWEAIALRTQELLDLFWKSAIENEQK